MSDSIHRRWQLPDGVDELLPDASRRVEALRRRIIDCCRGWGYELVMPPLIEYVDSLLTGTGAQMNLQTFKLTDQHTGRTLGVRADMTPQVARMDAHTLRREAPNRLCYTGTVLRARGDGFGGSRSPLQFGAELYGHDGPESDIEIVRLMIETVSLAGREAGDLLLDLGHVGVYRQLVADAGLPEALEQALFLALQRGSRPDLEDILDAGGLAGRPRERLAALPELQGDARTIALARDALDGAGPAVDRALQALSVVADALERSHPRIELHFDLAELRGFRYHTGMLFAVYDRNGAELARGGRYDDVGAAFGRARPATGFSGDLKHLATSVPGACEPRDGIFHAAADASAVAATDACDPWSEIRALRERGERVVQGFSGGVTDPAELGCDRVLVLESGRWVIRPLADAPEHDERRREGSRG